MQSLTFIKNKMKNIIIGFALILTLLACSIKATSNNTNITNVELSALEPSTIRTPTKTMPVNTLVYPIFPLAPMIIIDTPPTMQAPPALLIKTAEDSIADKKKILLVKNGQELYSVKCTKCHEAVEPKRYNEVKWEKVVDWMGPRAKLEASEKEAILAYVKFNAKK